ncbi:MAG TPA: methyltransferase domain-containing protein [Syntrophomonadaceae bacterium]|jgi:SAM-dependent methyltransferase|nr:methyltransferase domain-containing protein [Syntrophomonadaceae bacterium]
MNGLVNWVEIQKRVMRMPVMAEKDPGEFWGKSAFMYDKMSKLETDYTSNQLDTIILDAADSVLDVGCGPGRLAVPIAKRVARVTAIDASEEMLRYCKKNAQEQGLTNITTKVLDWKKAVVGKDIEKHDIVIASRSVGLSDLVKLNSAANKYVFVLSFAQSPSLKEVQMSFFEGISEEKLPDVRMNRMFGYNILFNILYDLGIDPNLRVVKDGFTRDYVSRQEAYDDLRQLGEVKKEQEPIFRKNIDKYLIEQPDGGVKFLRETKTYIMWWEPHELNIDLL